MRPANKMLMVFLVMVVWGGVLLSPAAAEDPGFSRKIVLFQENVPWSEIESYAAEWEPFGVSTVKELSFINALVLRVPEHISSEDLANDERVVSVESDQEVKLQAVSGAADGGAADGGAADGGFPGSLRESPPEHPHRRWNRLR